MIEDKLTQDQRIRLECLAQAMNHTLGTSRGGPTPPSAEQTIETASRFEKYVRGEA